MFWVMLSVLTTTQLLILYLFHYIVVHAQKERVPMTTVVFKMEIQFRKKKMVYTILYVLRVHSQLKR